MSATNTSISEQERITKQGKSINIRLQNILSSGEEYCVYPDTLGIMVTHWSIHQFCKIIFPLLRNYWNIHPS